MVKRRAGRMWEEFGMLPGIEVPNVRTAGPDGRIPAGGAQVTPAIMPQPGSLDPFPVIV
jgi:hypothetical protein